MRNMLNAKDRFTIIYVMRRLNAHWRVRCIASLRVHVMIVDLIQWRLVTHRYMTQE